MVDAVVVVIVAAKMVVPVAGAAAMEVTGAAVALAEPAKKADAAYLVA